MKLKTSFFNSTVFQKNLTRFAPVWVLYTVFLLLFLGVMVDSSYLYFADMVAGSLQVMAMFNLVYGLICALLLMGDLFNTRMCNALHAMPMRREGWFLTHVASGLIFALIPYTSVAVLAMPLLEELWYVSLYWLAGSMLQYLFFFGAAMLSAQCVGQRFAMAVVYGIINFFSLIAYWLLYTLYIPMLYGVILDLEPFTPWCPTVSMASEYQYVSIERVNEGRSAVSVVVGDGWGYLGICALVGVVLLGVALLMYRRRNLESAGDFISVRPLSPVFLVLYTLCGAAACHLFFYIFVSTRSMFFILVGMTIGFFTGLMLLQRTVRVLKKKNFLWFGVLMGVFGLSLLLTSLDPAGITRWVPDAESVRSVRYDTGSARYNDENYLTDPADVQAIIGVHRYGIENSSAQHKDRGMMVTLSYHLKLGTTVQREYWIDSASEAGKTIQAMMSRPEAVFGEEIRDLDAYAEAVVHMYNNMGDAVKREEVKSLLEAMLQDCREGNMAQDWSFHRDENNVDWFEFYYNEGQAGLQRHRSVAIYSSCRHTIKWLKDHGFQTMMDEKFG